MNLNFQEVLKRIIKYLVEGLMVAIACYAIPKASLKLDEIGLIALTDAATFSILDTYVKGRLGLVVDATGRDKNIIQHVLTRIH